MKKLALFCAVALFLSTISVGCAPGTFTNWCRTGSPFPVASSAHPPQRTVFMTAGSSSMWCNPCEPVMCAPCEPVMCHPCEPVCDPCMPRGFGAFNRGVVIPGPIH